MTERQFVKLCELPDFDDSDLLRVMRDMVPGLDRAEERHRKNWEWAMLGLYLESAGAITPDAEALAIAAGQEPPLFWLANRIRKIVATDIYGDGAFAEDGTAPATMINDPASFAPYPYREDHLEVRHMDALNADYPDETFDIVFCLSSIEHFGGPAAAARSASEMGRVLKPGGHLAITTEVFLDRHPLDSPKVQLAIRLATGGRRCAGATWNRRVVDGFTPAEIQRDIVDPLAQVGCSLIQPPDYTLSDDSRENVIHWGANNVLRPASGSPYPHIVLKGHGSPWTSFFLAFRKG